ncbi:MAG: nucleotidyltransferase family protein [Lachnospiraceae bacterium]
MKVCGIIAEFNPFHNGHAYLLQQARQLTDADYIIAIMSGDYIQRGEPAFLDKFVRTRIALQSGCDLVLELPLLSATGSAEYFARGSVAILHQLGVVDYLVFGSESGNPASADSSNLLPPNDILGMEYQKALAHFHSTMKAIPVLRIGTGYHDKTNVSGSICSASYLRAQYHKNNSDSTSQPISATAKKKGCETASFLQNNASFMPQTAVHCLQDYFAQANPIFYDDFSSLLYYQLLNREATGFSEYFDVYPDLSDKIKAGLEHFEDISSFRKILKSKDISYAHISRSLLHILLQITKEEEAITRDYDYCPYLRPLGFRRDATALLGRIRQNSSMPLLSKLADSGNILSSRQQQLLEHSLRASHLYQKMAQKKNAVIQNEFRRPLIIQE